MIEPQVVRRPARFAHLRNIPFFVDKDYKLADAKDKWVAVVLGVAVLIVVALDSAWLIGWIK